MKKNYFPRYTVLLSLDIVIRHKTCEKSGSIDFMGMAKSHSFFHIEKGNYDSNWNQFMVPIQFLLGKYEYCISQLAIIWDYKESFN